MKEYKNIYCLINRSGIGYVGETASYTQFFNDFSNKNRSLVRHEYSYDRRLSTMMNQLKFEKHILKKSSIESFQFDDINNLLTIKGSNDTCIIYNGDVVHGDLDSFEYKEELYSFQLEQIGLSTAHYIGMDLRNQRNAVGAYCQNELNNLISLPFLFEIAKKFYYKNRELKMKRETLEFCGYRNETIGRILHETITHQSEFDMAVSREIEAQKLKDKYEYAK